MGLATVECMFLINHKGGQMEALTELCQDRIEEYDKLASASTRREDQDFFAGKAAAYEDMIEDIENGTIA